MATRIRWARWLTLLVLLLAGVAGPLAQGSRNVVVMWDDVIDQGVIYADIEHGGVVTHCPALYVPEPGARGCNITVPVGTSEWRARVANVDGYSPWTAYVSITVPPVSSGDPPGPFRLLWHSPIYPPDEEPPSMATTVTRYVNTASSGGDGTTNATSGGTAAYASLSAAIAAEVSARPNLVTNDEILRILCAGTAADTTPVVIIGFTTDATRYISIEGNTGDSAGRHPGYWSTAHYRLEPSSSGDAVYVTSNYVRWIGVQVRNTWSTAGDHNPWGVNTQDSSNARVDSVIVRLTNAAVYLKGITLGASGVAVNSVVTLDGGYSGTLQAEGIVRVGYNAIAYNNTVSGFSKGYVTPDDGASVAQQFVVKNNIAHDCATGFDAVWQWGTNSDYNASTDATAPGSNSRQSQTFTFVNAASKDFHLGSADAGARGYATDLSADVLYPLSTDIDGQTRSTWDIGADEFSASGNAGSRLGGAVAGLFRLALVR